MNLARRWARGAGVHVRARVGRGTSMQGFYGRLLRFGDLAFDVGANLGQHTAMMLKRGARVVAIEPQATLARRLAERFPAAHVLALGVSDEPGTARLLAAIGNDRVTTLNPAWTAVERRFAWREGETVRLTTLDRLVEELGVPALVKIDTEGFEDRVLQGLTRPVRHVLFEVHDGLPDVAARAFARLDELGDYEYRVMEQESWIFSAPLAAGQILVDLPRWGDVHARLRPPR